MSEGWAGQKGKEKVICHSHAWRQGACELLHRYPRQLGWVLGATVEKSGNYVLLQEAAYNIARAAHHLNLLHIAVPFYERALESAPAPSAHPPHHGDAMAANRADEEGNEAAAGASKGAAAAARARPGAALFAEEGQQPATAQAEQCKHGLQCEAAYNLSLIYRSSGADELARQVLRRHLTL